MSLASDWTSGFPFESDWYVKEFYLGTLLDGWIGGTNDGESAILAETIKRGVELAISDQDVWVVYQRANVDQDGSTVKDRIIALIYKDYVYLREPGPYDGCFVARRNKGED